MVSYRLVPATALPVIQPSRTVLHVLIRSPRWRQFLEHTVFEKYRRPLIFAYGIAIVIMAAIAVLSPSSISWTGIEALSYGHLLGLPYVLMVILESRAHVLWLLAQTYEFWFLQTTLLVYLSCVSQYLMVERIGIWLMVPFICFSASSLDAVQFISLGEMLLPIVTSTFTTPPLIMIFLNLVPEANNFVVFRFKNHTLLAQEVLFNTLGTFAVFGAFYNHLYYRARFRLQSNVSKPQPQRNPSQSKRSTSSLIENPQQRFIKPGYPIQQTPIELMCYKTDVKWEPTTSFDAATSETAAPTDGTLLRLVIEKEQIYHSDDVLWPQLMCIARHHGWIIGTVFSMGWVLMIISIPVVVIFYKTPDASIALEMAASGLPILALLLTLSSLMLLIGLSHKKALIRVIRTFDVVFLTAQCTMAHVCAMDVVYWKWQPACLILSSWCWAQWLLLSDACLPATRDLIRLSSKWRIPLILLFLMAVQAFLAIEVLFLNQFELKDRAFIEIRIGGIIATRFRMVTTMLARFVTLTPYCCRLLWRHFHRLSDHALLLVEGPVEYDGDVPVLEHTLKGLQMHWQKLKTCIYCCTRSHRVAASPSQATTST